MRNALIVLSLLSLGAIGIGVCWLVLNPKENLHSGTDIVLSGVLIYIIDASIFAVRTFQQDRVAKQYLAKKGIVIRSFQELFQVHSEAAKPYKREALLQIIPFSALGLELLSQPVLQLALSTRGYRGYFPAVTTDVGTDLLGLTCFLVLPLSLLIYAFLTKME